MDYHLLELSFVLGLYFVVTFNIFNIVYEKQPTPYIDEVFHIPQGLKYCHGNFSEWDPKITTLPGLYFISFGILRTLEWIIPPPLCNIYNLRFINVVCSPVIFILIYSIIKFTYSSKTNKGLETRQGKLALWTAFNITSFPVSYLFIFFYYTETVSTLFFLIIYRLHIARHYWSAATAGFLSVIIRQTNIIWVGYFLLIMTYPKIRKMKLLPSDVLYPKKVLQLLSRPAWIQMYLDAAGYILNCFAFVVFLFVNGGIVVGDRNAHKPVLHLCQMFYFSLFSLAFSFPHYLHKIGSFIMFVKKNIVLSLLLLTLGVFAVYSFTMVHPYLLADNRHYSFYVWNKFYQKYEILRYLLLPVYFFGFYCINSSLEKKTEIPFWVCCTLCLAPQKLFDLRYFILPFLLLRLQIKCKTVWILAAESVLYLLINIITLYIFISKEFFWPDSDEVQRIIW